MFSAGNKKISRQCLIFNLPTRICKDNCSYCYAKKAERIYPAVKPARERNLALAKNTKQFMAKAKKEIVDARKRKYVRIHESGDFFSTAYVRAWYDIANAFPDKHFYAYTKRTDILDSLVQQKPSNFTLIASLKKIDYSESTLSKLATEYVTKGYDKIAAINTYKGNCPASNCMTECFKCIDRQTKIITFKKH